jgi:hypothetical protein
MTDEEFRALSDRLFEILGEDLDELQVLRRSQIHAFLNKKPELDDDQFREKGMQILEKARQSAYSYLSELDSEIVTKLAVEFLVIVDFQSRKIGAAKEQISDLHNRMKKRGDMYSHARDKKREAERDFDNLLNDFRLAKSIVNKNRSDRLKGADATHDESRKMKAEVYLWLDDNMVNFKSMDSAAQAIIKQQPIAFRTARDWVGKWKKLRSASKL